MECKKCGIDLSEREYKTVASWAFCLECFQALMNKAEERKKEPVEPEPPAATGEPLCCLVCEREIEPDAAHEMLGMMLCRECYENLIRKQEIPPRPEAGDQETEGDLSEKPAVMQVRVDLAAPFSVPAAAGRSPPSAASPLTAVPTVRTVTTNCRRSKRGSRSPFPRRNPTVPVKVQMPPAVRRNSQSD